MQRSPYVAGGPVLALFFLLSVAGTAVRPGIALAPRVARADDAGHLGYYRFPALFHDTVVFAAEGDLWRVPVTGGLAERLTTHLGEETRPAISADGRWIAFSATYDGPIEVYVMPFDGGLPKRLTWDGLRDYVVGWTPTGEVLFTTRRSSGFPAGQLVAVDPVSGRRRTLPLAQASDAAWLGTTLVFTRQEPNISNTRRYHGGTVQQLWTWSGGRDEAQPLFPGDSLTSRRPMPWEGRIYFVADRAGDMNLWSAKRDGSDARALTTHRGWDVLGGSLSEGRIAYQLGADLRIYDIAKNEDRAIPIRLASDLDQLREHWVSNPMDYVTSAHLSPTGDRVAITARGQVFVAPVEDGRLVEATGSSRVRWRQARFLPDGKNLIGLSDQSDEVEWWKLPANGVGVAAQITHDSKILRWDGVPSPDGRWLAHWNKDQELYLLDLKSGENRRIAVCEEWDDFHDISWSPDSRWLTFARPARDLLLQILLYDTKSGSTTPLTSDRWDSSSPVWSPDGKWLWFLSSRHFDSSVRSIWGSRQPDPFFDQTTRIYALALQKTFRSPWAKADELHPEDAKSEKPADKDAGKSAGATKGAAVKGGVGAADAAKKTESAAPVAIDLDGLASRLVEVPAGDGNFSSLSTDGKRLFFLSTAAGVEPKSDLQSLEIARKNDGVGTVLADVQGYELSGNGKKILVRKADTFYVFDAGAKGPEKLDKAKVPLAGWSFTVDPRLEFAQMFTEAWRLERDYFWDRGMSGVDWAGERRRFEPLAERVTTRGELADLFQQMIGDLSTLHMYVYGGDQRHGSDQVEPAGLGARLVRDDAAGGWKIDHRFRTDPEEPDRLGPLMRPDLGLADGDVITAINGTPSLTLPDPGAALRAQAGKQVLLAVKSPGGPARDVIVEPVSPARETDLRYTEWEYTRRLRVDSLASRRIGYVHLRAMGAADMAQWERDFYPVYDRDGLIIDLRGNRGGNVDSWILGKLLRRNWQWWQPRIGHPFGNMPFAFRGPIVVLVNETTISDGEDFALGFRKLGLGKVIGTRTWGGEIWLSSSNFLVDRGIATAAEIGLFGPEGDWMIEGHGVDPDVVVDDLPVATANGSDAQLDAAVRELLDDLARHPVPKPEAPRYPNKAQR